MIAPASIATHDPPAPAIEDRVSLARIALRHSRLLAAFTALGFGLGGLWLSQPVTAFESSAQILIIQKNPTIPSEDVNQHVGADRLVNSETLATQSMVIQSPLIVRRAVEEHKLRELPVFLDDSDPASRIIPGLRITQGGRDPATWNAEVLTLTYRGSSPEETERVLNAVLESYQRFHEETFEHGGQRTLALVAQAKDELQTQLRRSEDAYLEFLRSSPPVVDEKGRVEALHRQQLEELRSALAGIEVKRAELTAHLQAVETALARGTNREALAAMIARAGGTGTAEPASEKELRDLKAQEEVLLQDFGPNHPAVKSVRTRVALLTRGGLPGAVEAKDAPSGQDEFAVYLAARRQELEELSVRETELRASLERRQAVAEAELASARKAETAILLRERQDQSYVKEIDRTEKLFDVVLKGLQEISLVKDYGGYLIRVIAPASPGYPVRRNAAVALTVPALAGFVLAFVIGAWRDSRDDRFRSLDEIEQSLQIPVLTHIPPLTAPRRPVSGSGVAPTVVAWHDPASAAAEAIRGLGTTLRLVTRGGGPTILAITSTDPGDGRTTLAANLAVAQAQSGLRVLLVDASLGSPKLHALLPVAHPEHGLASYLDGSVNEPDELAQPTAVANLRLIPAGRSRLSAGQLLNSPRLPALLRAIAERFDLVLVDGGALQGTLSAAAVAAAGDGALFVMRPSRQARAGAVRAIGGLRRLGIPVIGAVVNQARVGVRSTAADGVALIY